MTEIVVGLSGVIFVLLGVCIKLWGDVQILKEWKQTHTSDHNNHDIVMNGTIDKLFNEIKEISKSINQILGKCGQTNCKE